MSRRGRRALLLVVLAAWAILLHPQTVPAQAPDPPTLAVFSQSLSRGLTLGTDDCTDAIRALTAGLLVRSTLTHVTEVGGARVIAERVIPRAPTIGLAYTLEGPRNEVAILVCAPAIAK